MASQNAAISYDFFGWIHLWSAFEDIGWEARRSAGRLMDSDVGLSGLQAVK